MDAEQQQSTPQESPSMFDTVTNVFASPREAYETVVGTPVRHSTWVIPFSLTLVLMFVGVYLVFNHPTFSQQMREAQMAQFQKQVDEGKMTQEQADNIANQMGSGGGTMFMVIGAIAGSIFVLLYYVLAALFLWLASKMALKTDAPYGKYLEVYGIASWIGIVGGVVTFVLMLALDSMYASASPALAILSNFDPMNTTHKFMKAADVFAAWQAVTIGVGLSTVAKKPSGTGIGIAVGLWLVWVVVSVLLGLAR